MDRQTTPQWRFRIIALTAGCITVVAINLQTWLVDSHRVNARTLLSVEGLVGVVVGALVTLLGLARTWGWPLPRRLHGSASAAKIAWRLALVGLLIAAMSAYMAWPLLGAL